MHLHPGFQASAIRTDLVICAPCLRSVVSWMRGNMVNTSDHGTDCCVIWEVRSEPGRKTNYTLLTQHLTFHPAEDPTRMNRFDIHSHPHAYTRAHTRACLHTHTQKIECLLCRVHSANSTHTKRNPSPGLNTADTMAMVRWGWTPLGLVCEYTLSSRCLAV